MAEDKVFAKWLYVNDPSEKAPDFVKFNVWINAEQFKEFLDANKDAKWFVNIDIKQKRDQSWHYGELNTYKQSKSNDNDNQVKEDEEDF